MSTYYIDGTIVTWNQLIPTQCANPWDEDMRQFMQKYWKESSRVDKLTQDEWYKIEGDIIRNYYESNEIKVYGMEFVPNAVPGDLCEGCSCNAGGHATCIDETYQ